MSFHFVIMFKILVCVYAFLTKDVVGYVKTSRIIAISSTRRLNTHVVEYINNPQQQSQYDVLTNDEPHNLDSKWLQIFDVTSSNNNPNDAISTPFKLPNVQAWRSSLNSDIFPMKETVETNPPTLHEYLNGIKELSKHHEQYFGQLWDKLKLSMKNADGKIYINDEGVFKIKEALRIAYITLHGKITVRSLEVSVDRARGTAAVLGELQADVNLILGGILSDVLAQLSSDPIHLGYLRQQLRTMFGEEVIQLCDSYNRLPIFMSKKADYTPIQSENQLQMLVSSAENYQTLFIRLADRLHTIRTLSSLTLSEQERKKLAEEALNVYAPLAHRMGVMMVKGELEDLALGILNPTMYDLTNQQQLRAIKAQQDAEKRIRNILNNDIYLKQQGATFSFDYRVKGKYQLFLKMGRKKLSLNQVRDALGMRIIFDYPRIQGEGESEESYRERGNAICYHLVTKLRVLDGWKPSDNGFKDYIKNQKENGYQSLHQYIKSVVFGTHTEVQVRTKAMHDFAELGEAAHWAYKDSIYRPEISETKIYRQAWRSPAQVNAKKPEELFTLARQQLLTSRVYVFLDDCSTVLNLQKGATALDAAFALHSDVGLTLANVRIGNSTCGFNRVLQNGDVISFEASVEKTVTADPAWLDMVKTSHASGHIRKHLRDAQRGTLACIGLVQLLMCMTLSSTAIQQRHPQGLDANKLLRFMSKRSKYNNVVDLLVNLGSAQKSDLQSQIGGLMDIGAANLTCSSVSLSTMWARMQGRNGWEDKEMQRNVLLPFINRIIPDALGDSNNGVNIQQLWVDLFGARCLLEEDEPDSLLSLGELNKPYQTISHHHEGHHELDYPFTKQYVITAPNTIPPKPVVQHRIPVGILQPPRKPRADERQTTITTSGIIPTVGGVRSQNAEMAAVVFNAMHTLTSVPTQPIISRSRSKSPVTLVRQPFSLEAPSLSQPLLRLARKTYGDQQNAKSRTC